MLIGTVRAINDLTYWRITVTNGPVPNTNVEVEFTIPTEFSISNSTIVPVGTLVGDTWTVGAMTPGQVISADIILKFDGPVPGVAEEFEIEATVTGTGDTNSSNNTKIDTINFEILSCDPFASGSNCSDGLKFDLSECSTPCTQGATPHWTIDEEGSVNVEIISFDEDSGIGFYKFIDPTLQGSISWGLECILGEDTITICASYTLTLHPIIDNKNVFDHTADFVNGSTLTDLEVATLKSQSAYSAFTDEQIREFCWEVLYNSNGDLVGGWAHACTGEQDNRHFIFCSEETCEEAEDLCPSCPYTNMPTDVSEYLDGIENYVAEKGDNITVYHPGAISVYEYDGSNWVRSSCGCITFLNNPYPISFTVTGTTTKTATITLSDTTTLTASFTDNNDNTTYTMTLVNLLGINYIRLLDNLGNIVSSVMLPTTGGDCCCDCTMNLIPTQDGALASTNCDVTWTGEGANVIWEARPVTGDEEDWVTLDGGYHNGEYDNGAVGLYIRVRYTIDSCERFSNIVTPLVCPCWTQIVITDDINEFRLERENCGTIFDIDDFEWQVRTAFGTWVTIQTGGVGLDYNTLSGEPEFPEVLISPIIIRGKYTDPFGCVHFTNTEYIIIP